MAVSRSLSLSWTLWLWWVLACTLAGTFASTILFQTLNGFLTLLLIFLNGGAIGIIVGFAQWLILRGKIPEADWWVLFSSLGWFVCWNPVAAAMLEPLGEAFGIAGIALGYAWQGAIVGLAQWLVLRWSLRRASFWILASSLGWCLGVCTIQPDAGHISWSAVWAIYSAITGAMLLWLLQQRR